VPRKKSKFTMKDIKKFYVGVANSLIEGKSAEEIQKTMIATEVIGKQTKQLMAEFDALFAKKWTEYCDLMKESPKVHEMFSQPMKA